MALKNTETMVMNAPRQATSLIVQSQQMLRSAIVYETYHVFNEKINFVLPMEPREASSNISKSPRRLAPRSPFLFG
jgi:hypothetical protein